MDESDARRIRIGAQAEVDQNLAVLDAAALEASNDLTVAACEFYDMLIDRGLAPAHAHGFIVAAIATALVEFKASA